MTDQEKLEALITKAIDGGWDYRGFVHEEDHTPLRSPDVSIYEIIFNHDFAKALWGEDERQVLDCGHTVGTETGATFEHTCDGWEGTGFSTTHIMWQYHLQQMVIADDPIDYAYKSVFGDK